MEKRLYTASEILDRKSEEFKQLKSGERHNRLFGLAIAAWYAGYRDEDKLLDYIESIYKQCSGGCDYADCENTAANVVRKMQDGSMQSSQVVGEKRKADKEQQARQDAHREFFRAWCEKVMDGTYVDTADHRFSGTQEEAVLAICSDPDAFYFAGNKNNDKSVTAYWRGQVGTTLEGAVYFSPNPLTRRERISGACKHVDYLLLEMDEALADVKADPYTVAYYSELCDQQCKWWSHIILDHGLPVRSVTYSGGKSVHVLVPVDSTVDDLEKHRSDLSDLYTELHLDKQNIDPVRKTRIPMGLRIYKQAPDGRILDLDDYTTAVKDLKAKSEDKKGKAYAKLDKYGMTDPSTLTEGYLEQELLYLDKDAKPISLDDLIVLLQGVVDEFIQTSPNAFEDALLKNEKIEMSFENFEDYLKFSKRTIRMNEITREVEVKGWRTDDINTVANQVYDDWSKVVDSKSFVKIEKNIEEHIASDKYNPVAEWLTSLTWDGMDRLPAIYDILGITGDIQKTLIHKWLMQCVAMAYNDGRSAAVGVLTLIGAQNVGKTSFFRKLVPTDHLHDWWSEGKALDTDDKDSLLQLTRGWLMELGEVDATTRKEQASLKAVITRGIDKIRPPYGRGEVVYNRHVSMCATVNVEDYLLDTTGNRRWWSVKVPGSIKLDEMDRLDIAQLWAQIRAEYDREGSRCYWLTQDEVDRLAEVNDKQRADAGFEDELRFRYDWSSSRDWCSLREVCDTLSGDKTMSKGDKTAVKKSLEAMHVEIKRTTSGIMVKMPRQWATCDDRRKAQQAAVDDGADGVMPF